MKYIFIDIDGTLYSSEIDDIPKSALLAIKLAREKGNKVFLCTGRSLAVSKLFLNLDVDGFTFSAGALVQVDGQRIVEKTFTEDSVNFLIDSSNKNEMGICLEGNTGAYYNERGYQSIVKYFSGKRSLEEIEKIMVANCYYPMVNYHFDDSISKSVIYGGSVEQINKLNSILPANLKGTIAFEDEQQCNFGLEITDKNINKATGIRHILNQYPNATFKDVVAIGDSANDIDMVKAARIGIAMGNAALPLKNSADYITANILDDGIYKAFEHYKLF
jgi:Cof subfamily protein (haloacid dehalogenase superfamily)